MFKRKKFKEISRILDTVVLDKIAYLLVTIFIIVGIVVSVNRFKQYEVYYIDFGEYDQAIWEIAHFQPPMIDHFVHGFVPIFADHFPPSVFLLSPLYWITSSKVTILVAQSIIVGLSGLVLYSIGKILLKKKFISISIMICYFLFVGLQNAVITEFHELTVMTLPLMLTFWCFLKKKKAFYFLFLFLTLGFKESLFFLGAGIGMAVFFLDKKWRKEAIITIILSLLYGFIILKLIIPYLSSNGYLYTQNMPDGVVDKILALGDHPLKRHTLFYSLFSFGFLPLLSPQFWFMMLQDYAGRFETKYFMTRWDLGLHYNAQSAVILSLASLYGFFLIQKTKIKKYMSVISVLLILNAIFLNRFVLNGPFNLFLNSAFYKHSENFAFLDNMVNKIPLTATVATHNNLAAKFTHQRVWLVTKDYEIHKPDYILIDDRKMQSPNNYLGSGDLKNIVSKLLKDHNYEIIFRTKEQYIFKIKKS